MKHHTKHHIKHQAPLNFAFYTKKQTSQARWLTLILTTSTVFMVSALCILQARQLVLLYRVKQEYATLKQYTENQKQKVARKTTLTKKHTALQKKLTLFATHERTLLTLLLKELSHALPDIARINTLDADLQQKIITITGHALNSEGVTTLVRTLSSTKLFKTVTLTSIDKHPHHLYCTFTLHANLNAAL